MQPASHTSSTYIKLIRICQNWPCFMLHGMYDYTCFIKIFHSSISRSLLTGSLSLEEFEDACSILSKHIGTEISKQNVKDMATSMDINKDGLIDFNEFLEAFRLVDPESQQGLVKSQENGNGATATADEKGTLT